MNHKVLFIALGLVSLISGIQSPPNIDGRWSVILDPTAPNEGRASYGGGNWGPEFTLSTESNSLIVVYTQGYNPVRLTYKLDGSESRNQIPVGRAGEKLESLSRAKWENGRLSITTVRIFGGMPIETKLVVSLDGERLVILTTNPSKDKGPPTVIKTVYRRS